MSNLAIIPNLSVNDFTAMPAFISQFVISDVMMKQKETIGLGYRRGTEIFFVWCEKKRMRMSEKGDLGGGFLISFGFNSL